jgi:hypothetical protein
LVYRKRSWAALSPGPCRLPGEFRDCDGKALHLH